MSLYILDTDIATLAQQGNPAVGQRIMACPAADLALSVISVEELLSGWNAELRKARHRAELARVYEHIAETIRFCARLQIVSFSESAILLFEDLRTRKLNVSSMDLRIAAIVLERGAILVTRNSRDFQRVPGLQIEDWTV